MAPAAVARSGPYRRLLRLPGVGWQAAGGLLAQLTQGAASIGIILVVRQHGGSLGEGGIVTGAVWAAAGIARPLQGRLIDRQGPRKVMAWSGVIHALGLAGIVLLSGAHAVTPLLVASGLIAGVALPPVSSSMRVHWAELLGPDERTAAYSLVYLTQQVAILIGPLLLAGAVGVASAGFGLLTVAAATAAGALVFSASVGESTQVARQSPAGRPGPVLGIVALRLLLALALLVGATLGALEVAVTALASAHRTPAIAGVLVACLSVGGIAGALLYGGREWSSSAAIRLRLLLLVVSAALVPLVGLDSLPAAGALLALAGIAFNPALTTFSLLIDQDVPATAAAEAFGWFSTALAAGTAAGNVLAGALAQSRHAFRPGFVIAASAVAAATLLSLLVSRSR